MAHISSSTLSFDLGVAVSAESSSLVLDEPQISQFLVTHLTGETLRVPRGHHGFDDSPDDELAALSAAGGKQDVEVVLTVLAALKLVEDAVRKRPEALGADEAFWMKQFAVRVDDFGLGLESVVAASANHAIHVHYAVKFNENIYVFF